MQQNATPPNTFLQEWYKIWNWIVFVFRLLGQMGGFRGVIKALGQAIVIPIRRGLLPGSGEKQ